MAYVQATLAKDEAAIGVERSALILRRRLARQQRTAFDTLAAEHAFDFSQAASLFTAVAKTDAEILQLLTQDDTTVYLRGRTLTGNIRITGQRHGRDVGPQRCVQHGQDRNRGARRNG